MDTDTTPEATTEGEQGHRDDAITELAIRITLKIVAELDIKSAKTGVDAWRLCERQGCQIVILPAGMLKRAAVTKGGEIIIPGELPAERVPRMAINLLALFLLGQPRYREQIDAAYARIDAPDISREDLDTLVASSAEGWFLVKIGELPRHPTEADLDNADGSEWDTSRD